MPRISEAFLFEAYPILRQPYLLAAPSKPAPRTYVAANWMNPEVSKNWLQVMSGYFVPPVTGDYLFFSSPIHPSAR